MSANFRIQMNKTFQVLGLVVGILAVTSLAHGQVLSGQLNLSELSETNPLISLEGQWRFYPNVLEPTALQGQPPQLVKTPGYWPLSDGLRRFGYGLYHLRVTRCTYPQLALKLGGIFTAYTVWINNHSIAQSGQPATDAENFEPNYRTQVVPFRVPAEEFNIYILVSNFAHRKGGILGTLYTPLAHQVTLDNLERINSEFVSRLKKQYPNLTPAEQELCICLKAKLFQPRDCQLTKHQSRVSEEG